MNPVLKVTVGLSLMVGTVAMVGTTDYGLTRSAQAIEFLDGSTAFIHPPRFIEASNTRPFVSARNSTQFFTLDLPESADEPLQSVNIVPQNFINNLRAYQLEETRAFEGARFSQGAELALGDVTVDPDTKTITVTFDPPVPPGRLVTIALRPQHNPRASGIYIFRLIASPPGEQPRSHVAGHARINIDDRGDRDPFIR